MKDKQNVDKNPWHPMTDPVGIKHIGKLQEELGELNSALARCLIQGIDEAEPVTGKPNKQWLREEIADVYASLSLLEEHFNISCDYERIEQKQERLRRWHSKA